MKSIIRSIFTITIFSVATRAFGFLYKIGLSRIMSTEELGIYNITLSLFAVLITILCSGIGITVSRYVSINNAKSNNKHNNKLIFSALILCLVLATIISLFIVFGEDVLTSIMSSEISYRQLLYLIPSIIVCAIYTPFKSYLIGKELFFQSSIVEFIEQIIRMVACFAIYFFIDTIDIIFAPIIAMSIAAVLSTILGIYYYKRNGGGISIQKPSFQKLIKTSTPITLVKTLSTIMMPIITITVPIIMVENGYSNNEALSLLGIITGMTLPLLSIPGTITGSLCTALLPQISMLHEENNNSISRQVYSSIKFTIIITSLCVPIFIGLGKPICELIFNNTQAGIWLSYASWIMIPMGISQITTTILNSIGREKASFFYYVISTIFMTISIVFLTKYIGILSVIIGLAVNNIITATLNTMKIKKTNGLNKSIIPLLIKAITVCTIVGLITKFLYNILSHIIAISIINIGISCLISILSFLVLSTTLGLIDYNIIKEKLCIKLKQKLTRNKNITLS
ncbi:MAG: hypothetical protein E7361_01325 [Clostridiales bacterium]|nr:hypothetical protein [Clostridiales bacterium]